MIKEALQYIVGLSEAKTQEINGQVYSDKNLIRISHNPKAEAISMSTLTSLVTISRQELIKCPTR